MSNRTLRPPGQSGRVKQPTEYSTPTVGHSSDNDSGPLSFHGTEEAAEKASKTAVIYLRVSTERQARKGGEAEGYSIPAQRQACIQQARLLGAVVVEEFVDAGASARSADRPQLQAMLHRLKTGDVDYVIIHKIDRLARNRGDDVGIMLAIHQCGTALVSVTEKVDDTPTGKMLHGIMATFAEFYSSNLAMEARKGLQEKVRRGGTPHYAPLGYVNTQRTEDGYDVRGVAIDLERADHIRWAFATYATGDWSLSSLRDALEDRGLKSRKTKKMIGQPLNAAQVHRMLKNPYYKGYLLFKGALYEGNHEPLVDEVTWQRVQDVLAGRRIAGDRSWRHTHYLKGLLRCARCDGRMGYGHARGKMNVVYDYFFCLGRHTGRTDCDLPYASVSQIEKEVERQWNRVTFTASQIDEIRTRASQQLEETTRDNQHLLATQQRRLTQLNRQKEKLLDAYLADAMSVEDLKMRQTLVQTEIADAKRLIEEARQDLDTLRERLEIILALLERGGRIYSHTTDGVTRQLLNEAMFEAIYIDYQPDTRGHSGIIDHAPLTEVVNAVALVASPATSAAQRAARGRTGQQST